MTYSLSQRYDQDMLDIVYEYVNTFPNLFPSCICKDLQIEILMFNVKKVDTIDTKYITINNKIVGRFQKYEYNRLLLERFYNIYHRLHGPYKRWNHTGQLIENGTYVNGQLHGPYFEINIYGRLIKTRYQYGKIHGTYTMYRRTHLNGQIQSNIVTRFNMINGIKQGRQIYYSTKDDINIQYYKDGELHGCSIQLTKIIQSEYRYIKKTKTQYSNGKRHGKFMVIYTNVQPNRINDDYELARLPIGPRTNYILYVGYYQDGKLHGPYTQYFLFSNKIKIQTYYHHGSIHGPCKIWNDKYNQYITYKYEYGMLNPICTMFMPDGRIQYKRVKRRQVEPNPEYDLINIIIVDNDSEDDGNPEEKSYYE